MTRLKGILIALLVATVSFVVGYYGLRATTSGLLFDAPEVNWRELGEFDYITGEGPEKLTSLDKKMVKVPGFMVPLEDNLRSVTEFLLVPTPQACIHVPPPPPNQMILVQMKSDKSTPVAFGPIWVYGVLKIFSVRHLYGESSFVIEGTAVEVYK